MVNFNSKLWTRFENVCNAYLKVFCKKHDFDYDDAKDSWVANFAGTIVNCADYYFSMEDIIVDIEMDAPEDELIKWYDYSLDRHEKGLFALNYESWLRGCPLDQPESKRVSNDPELGKNQRIEDMKIQFLKFLEDLKGDFE